MRRIALCMLLLALPGTGSTSAPARPLHAHSTFPAAETAVSGRNTQYIVHLDGWVDHAASRLAVAADGRRTEVLVPTLASEPDVLAAIGPRLPPGRYQLRWHAKSVPDGDFSDGSVPFSIRE